MTKVRPRPVLCPNCKKYFRVYAVSRFTRRAEINSDFKPNYFVRTQYPT